MRNYAVLEGMKRHQKTVLDDAFNKGYEQGYRDGKLNAKVEKFEELKKELDDEKKAEYKRGYEHGRMSMLTIKDFEEIRRSQYDKGYEDGKKLNMNDAYEVGFIQGKKTAEEFNERKAMDEFNKGYHKGLQHGQELRAKEAECAEACGMKRAWEVARKILSRHGEGYDATDMEVFGTDDVFSLSASEAVAKLDEWEKKQERYCYNCGQPRDYKNSCIPYKEGKCDKSHKAWIPKQEETEKNCDKCKHDNVASGIDGTCYECIKGVRDNYEEKTEKSCEKCRHDGFTCDSCEDMSKFEEVGQLKEKQDAPEMNVESIAVWDEVEDNIGNRTVVTHIYSDDKYANADVIDADGCCSCMPLELLEKTGRRFCFQELLNAMKKDDVEEAETNENK